MQIDLSPLYRNAIGIDRLAHMLEKSNRNGHANYPPYNIEQLDENNYRITMAIAGFAEDEIELITQNNTLEVKGEKKAKTDNANYLYQGIVNQNFERKFELADYVKVSNAELQNGLLNIELVREVPEAAKPRKIAINQR
ncbi:Hsp20 family protein [Dongshaea marina]|uniref:Hsp20 family protein n=1 Tax=Dongshaea marina TaxID=2047966 RepID=UPI000D3E3297|nr:Hsp20 family protein [Dongshaea marina]